MPIAAIRSEGGKGASVDRRSAPAAKTVSAIRERGAMLVAQKPCSGCGLSVRMRSATAAADGPIVPAHATIRDGGHAP